MRFIASFLIIFAAIIVTPSAGHAQGLFDQDTTFKAHSWTALPSISYSTTTRWLGGGFVQYIHRKNRKVRPSSLSAVFIVTQNKQLIGQLIPSIYWDDDKNYAGGVIAFTHWPNVFYGIGPNAKVGDAENFLQENFTFSGIYLRRLNNHFRAGVRFVYENYTISEAEATKSLSTSTILGSEGGVHTGVGISISYDTRNNVYLTQRGYILGLKTMWHLPAIGSDFRFAEYSFDARYFKSVWANHVIAGQFYSRLISGKAPFYALARNGVAGLLRPYRTARYRDQVFGMTQVEYRMPVWKKLGIVGFAGVGSVSANVGGLVNSNFFTSFGVGLRFAVNPAGLNLRIDYGWGAEGTRGLGIAIGEAF